MAKAPSKKTRSAAKAEKPKTKPAAKKAAAKPSQQKPSQRKPAAKKPAAKKPAAKKPAAKKPAPKQPAAKQTAAKKPAPKQPAAKQTAAKKPTAKKPAPKAAGAKPASAAKKGGRQTTGKAATGAVAGTVAKKKTAAKPAPKKPAGRTSPARNPAATGKAPEAPSTGQPRALTNEGTRRPPPGSNPPSPAAAQILGQVCWLMMQSPAHKHMFVTDMEWLAIPAVISKQFRLYRTEKSPWAFVSWAFLDVEAENRRDADGPGGATLAADEQKARALSATPEFADCGTNAAEAVTRAQLILENRDTDDGGETYLGDVSYRHLMSERLAQILTALDVQRKCTDNPAGQQSIANVRAEALRLFDRAYGSGASRDGAEMSKWDLILNPNRPCGPASQTAVAGAYQSLAELRILLHQDMNLIARREMAPVNLWRMTDYRTYHPFHRVSLAIEPNGQLAVGTLPPYTEGRLLFDRFAGSTLDATREKQVWSGAPSLTALIPRRTITPLGTVYRKPVDGNWAAYDEGPAQNLGEAVITEAVPAAAFTAMMLGRSLLGLLDRDDEAMRQFKRHLSTQASTELAAHAINVLAEGIEIELLPSDSSRQLIPLVQQQSFLDDSAFYLVMDRIVQARKSPTCSLLRSCGEAWTSPCSIGPSKTIPTYRWSREPTS